MRRELFRGMHLKRLGVERPKATLKPLAPFASALLDECSCPRVHARLDFSTALL